MTKHYALSAQKRDRAGKGSARALRRKGTIPAVVYGDKQAPITITLPLKETSLQYNSGQMFTTLCDLDVEGEKHLVLARDVQLHPVSDNVLHVDFLRVTPKTKITVSVPVNFVNFEDSPASHEKGVLNVVRFEVDLVCQATKIPETININMAEKQIGDAVKISDAELPEGTVPAIDDRDFTIATIAAPRKIIDDAPAEDGEGEAAEGEGEASGDAGASEGDAADQAPSE